MSIENKKYLGWGIVGTPAGRQQVGYGVDKQLNLAKTFDLAQEFGGCLIDPRQNDEPLYRLSYLTQNDISVVGVAEYRSIFEQGQTRAGTYFGAFIETVNCQISERTVPTLLSALWDLSAYQFKNFIDPNKRAYTQSINGVEIQAPEEKLDEIAQGLTPLVTNYLTQTPQNGDLYIHCQKGEAVETLTLLLKTGVFYRYKQIFFSESQHISAQIQRKRVEQMTFEQLKAIGADNQPWIKEVGHLRAIAGQLKEAKVKLESHIRHLESNQQQIVEQQLKSKEMEYQRQVQHYQQKAAQAEQKVQDMNTFTVLGQKLSKLYEDNREQLVNSELPLKKERDPVVEEVRMLMNGQMSALKMEINRLAQAQQQEVEPQKSSSVLTWIFGALSAVLLAILLGNVVWNSFISDDRTISENEYKKYQKYVEEKPKLDEAKNNLESEKSKLEKANKDLTKKYDELSKDYQKISDELLSLKENKSQSKSKSGGKK